MRIRKLAALAAFGLLALAAARPAAGDPPAPKGGSGTYPHLLLGNPSNAKEDGADRNNLLLKKEFFALSYDDAKGTPNWVSWRLSDLKVFRVGKVKVDVYLVGRTAQGDWAGLRTTSVET